MIRLTVRETQIKTERLTARTNNVWLEVERTSDGWSEYNPSGGYGWHSSFSPGHNYVWVWEGGSLLVTPEILEHTKRGKTVQLNKIGTSRGVLVSIFEFMRFGAEKKSHRLWTREAQFLKPAAFGRYGANIAEQVWAPHLHLGVEGSDRDFEGTDAWFDIPAPVVRFPVH